MRNLIAIFFLFLASGAMLARDSYALIYFSEQNVYVGVCLDFDVEKALLTSSVQYTVEYRDDYGNVYIVKKFSKISGKKFSISNIDGQIYLGIVSIKNRASPSIDCDGSVGAARSLRDVEEPLNLRQ